MDQKGSWKAQWKGRETSPTKKSWRDRNTSKETSGHESKDQETLETRPLGEILSTAEICRWKQKQGDLRSMQ